MGISHQFGAKYIKTGSKVQLAFFSFGDDKEIKMLFLWFPVFLGRKGINQANHYYE
jgi:hypothetical protein